MADMIVAGAGTSFVNGTYVEYGVKNSRPAYSLNGDEAYIYYYSSWLCWVISITLTGQGNYYASSGYPAAATPDLEPSWTVISGSSPAPTVTAASSSQNLTLTCAVGSYSQTGVACTLTYTPAAQNLTLSCGAGSLALTGSNATFEVKRNFALSCSAGSYAVTGTAATFEVKRNYVLSASAGSYAVTGSDCTLTKNLVMAVTQTTSDVVASGAGTTVVNGLYKYVNYGQYFKNDASAVVYPFVYGEWYVIGINGGVYYSAIKAVDTPDLVDNWQVEIDGTAPVPAFTVSPDVGGAFYLMQGVGSTLTVQRNYTLSCGAGSYSLTGSDVSFGNTIAYTLACGAGSYAVTGSDVTLDPTLHYTLACSAGSYALTGSSVTPFAALKPATDYMLTDQYFGWFGFPVNYFPLEATSANVDYSLACGAGSYTLSGTAVALTSIHTYSLACNSGSYLLTGTPTSLTSARSLACNSGAYVLTGLEADLFKGLVMPCGNGSYVLTGTPATINSARTFALGMGSYVLVGMNAGLYILTITPDCRTYFIDAENRTLLIGSEDRTHTIDAENRTMEVRCH